MSSPTVVVVDYGLGNLFSVQRALEKVGDCQTTISNDSDVVLNADRLLLPGVGAFGDGMDGLRSRNLVPVIKEFASSGRPVLGVCLGMQLIMSQSEEFGHNTGLDLLPGKVELLKPGEEPSYKIPHIGWNELYVPDGYSNGPQKWNNSLLGGNPIGASMYFVHSYAVVPDDPSMTVAVTRYGNAEYCSVIEHNNVTGAQFHPELSGEAGLNIYWNFVHR